MYSVHSDSGKETPESVLPLTSTDPEGNDSTKSNRVNLMDLSLFSSFNVFDLIIPCIPHNGCDPDNKDHGANIGPTWVPLAPRGSHVGPMNLAIRRVPRPPHPPSMSIAFRYFEMGNWSLNYALTAFDLILQITLAQPFQLHCFKEHWDVLHSYLCNITTELQSRYSRID